MKIDTNVYVPICETLLDTLLLTHETNEPRALIPNLSQPKNQIAMGAEIYKTHLRHTIIIKKFVKISGNNFHKNLIDQSQNLEY